MKRVLAIMCSAVLFLNFTVLAHANAPEGRNLNVFDVTGDELQIAQTIGSRTITPRPGQRLSSGNVLTTGWDSFIYVQFDQTSIFKMDESSQTIVSSARNRLVLTVQSGGVLVEVEPQAEGHSLETRLGNTAIGVRGTSYFVRRGLTGELWITMISGYGEAEFVTDAGELVTVPLEAGQMMLVSYEDVPEDAYLPIPWYMEDYNPWDALEIQVEVTQRVDMENLAVLVMPIQYEFLSLFELVELYERFGYEHLLPLIRLREMERSARRESILEAEQRLGDDYVVPYFALPQAPATRYIYVYIHDVCPDIPPRRVRVRVP